MTLPEILLAVVVVFLLVVGMSCQSGITEETLDRLDKLDTLEDRIRAARSYMCDSDTVDDVDYTALKKILDPENDYEYNPANDY